jgi:outer membrane murein-binding lipoprotein Lpp
MGSNDPRRGHEGYDETIRPAPRVKRVMGAPIIERGQSPPPSMHVSPQEQLWGFAKRWSPAGIAASAIILFLAVGGHEGVGKLSDAISKSSDSQRALAASVDQLTKEVTAIREQNQRIMAKQHAQEKNLSALCDAWAKTNGQRPNKSWCSNDGKAVEFNRLIASGGGPGPLVTDYNWIHGQ